MSYIKLWTYVSMSMLSSMVYPSGRVQKHGFKDYQNSGNV